MILLSIIFGCSSKIQTIPSPTTPFVPMEPAQYEIGSWEQSKVCADYFLFFRLGHDFSMQYGHLANNTVIGFSRMDTETSEAFYNIIRENPTVTHLIYPRAEVSQSRFVPLVGRRCSTVQARTIRVGSGLMGREFNKIPINSHNSTTSNLTLAPAASIEVSKYNQDRKVETPFNITTQQTQPTQVTSGVTPDPESPVVYLDYRELTVTNGDTSNIEESKRCKANTVINEVGKISSIKFSGCKFNPLPEDELRQRLYQLEFEPYVTNDRPNVVKTTIWPTYLEK